MSYSPGRMLAFLGLLAGATIGVHVEIAAEVSSEERDAVTAAIADAIGKSTDHRAVLSATGPKICSGGCLSSTKKRLRAEELLLTRYIGGASRIRVTMTRVGEGADKRQAHADLEVEDRGKWADVVSQAVVELYGAKAPPAEVAKPEPVPEAPALTPAIETQRPEVSVQHDVPRKGAGPPVIAYLSLGAGGALVVTGAVLWLSANASLSDLRALEEMTDSSGKIVGVTKEEYDRRADSIDTRNTIGWITVGLGAAAIGAGIYLLFDSDEGEGVAIVPAPGGAGVVARF
jgi:hypothetical protein